MLKRKLFSALCWFFAFLSCVCVSCCCWVLWFSSKDETFWCTLSIHTTHKICMILDCYFLFALRPTVRSDSISLHTSFSRFILIWCSKLLVLLSVSLSLSRTHSLSQTLTVQYSTDFQTILNDCWLFMFGEQR